MEIKVNNNLQKVEDRTMVNLFNTLDEELVTRVKSRLENYWEVLTKNVGDIVQKDNKDCTDRELEIKENPVQYLIQKVDLDAIIPVVSNIVKESHASQIEDPTICCFIGVSACDFRNAVAMSIEESYKKNNPLSKLKDMLER